MKIIENLEKINYLEIFKKALKISWEGKYLWWFGFLMALGGIGNFNLNFPNGNDNASLEKILGFRKREISDFFVNYHNLVVLFLLLLFVLLLAFAVLKIISQAGLIKSIAKIESDERTSFREGFKEGKKYFWKMLVMKIILGFFSFIIVVILLVPVVFLFFSNSLKAGFIMAFLAIIILIPLMVLMYFLEKYSSFYIVLSDLGIKNSLENGYKLFKNNIASSMLMALFFLPVTTIVAVILVTAFVILGIVFLVVGFALNYLAAQIGISVAIGLGLLFFALLTIFVNAICQVFYQSAWLIFFKEIATPKGKEVVEEKGELVKNDEIITSPESVN